MSLLIGTNDIGRMNKTAADTHKSVVAVARALLAGSRGLLLINALLPRAPSHFDIGFGYGMRINWAARLQHSTRPTRCWPNRPDHSAASLEPAGWPLRIVPTCHFAARIGFTSICAPCPTGSTPIVGAGVNYTTSASSTSCSISSDEQLKYPNISFSISSNSLQSLV